MDGDVRIWTGLEDDDPSSHCVGEQAFTVVHKVSTGKVITIMSMGILLDWLTNLGYVAF
jgi:hypothetical protein